MSLSQAIRLFASLIMHPLQYKEVKITTSIHYLVQEVACLMLLQFIKKNKTSSLKLVEKIRIAPVDEDSNILTTEELDERKRNNIRRTNRRKCITGKTSYIINFKIWSVFLSLLESSWVIFWNQSVFCALLVIDSLFCLNGASF